MTDSWSYGSPGHGPTSRSHSHSLPSPTDFSFILHTGRFVSGQAFQADASTYLLTYASQVPVTLASPTPFSVPQLKRDGLLWVPPPSAVIWKLPLGKGAGHQCAHHFSLPSFKDHIVLHYYHPVFKNICATYFPPVF